MDLPLVLLATAGIGVTLGLLGGGGSVLLVPLLAVGLGLPAHHAIAHSLFVVAVTSAVALVPHARAGNVRWRTGVLFGGAGMVGGALGGLAARWVSGELLLAGFSVMMLMTALALLRRESARGEGQAPRRGAWWVVVLEGLAVGGVTGMVGAGGGFLVVPALVVLGGLPMKEAVGTSLLVIAAKSFAAWSGHASLVGVDPMVLSLAAAAVLGSLLGARWSLRLPARPLSRALAVLVLLVGAHLLGRQAAGWWGLDPWTASGAVLASVLVLFGVARLVAVVRSCSTESARSDGWPIGAGRRHDETPAALPPTPGA